MIAELGVQPLAVVAQHLGADLFFHHRYPLAHRLVLKELVAHCRHFLACGQQRNALLSADSTPRRYNQTSCVSRATYASHLRVDAMSGIVSQLSQVKVLFLIQELRECRDRRTSRNSSSVTTLMPTAVVHVTP